MVKNIKTQKEKIEQAMKIIKNLQKENNFLKKKLEDQQTMNEIIAHDLINPLGGIKNAAELVNMEKFDPYLFARLSKLEAEKALNTVQLSRLYSKSDESIKQNSTPIILEDLAKETMLRYKKDLEENKINFKLKYGEKDEIYTITINANKAAFETIFYNLIGNAINHTPQESAIRQGIKINKENNLEILTENYHLNKELRRVSGLGEGIGTKVINKLIKIYKGKITNYSNPLIGKDYGIYEAIGPAENKENKKDKKEIWGVKIEIPMKELTII